MKEQRNHREDDDDDGEEIEITPEAKEWLKIDPVRRLAMLHDRNEKERKQ
jgi:hypothetical protein